jgi:hypothetical protein
MNTEFYDITNAAVIGWQAAVRKCCDIQPTSHPESLTAEMICAVTGLLPLYPFEVPDGMVATGPMWVTVIDGVAYKRYQVITLEAHEAQQAACVALQQAEAADAMQARIAALTEAYGADIVIIGRLLAVFGVSIPCDAAAVMATIKGGLASGRISLDLAPYADTLEARYKAVREAMTDDEIVAVAKMLESKQGQTPGKVGE